MLQARINEDLKEFLKAGKSFEAGVLRLMVAALKNKEIANRGLVRTERGQTQMNNQEKLTDEEIVDLLMKEVKKRKEAAEVYKKGNREDLAENEMKELAVIKKYLPEELSAEEVGKIIDKAIAVTGATSLKEMGKAVAEAAKELKGRADMAEVSKAIKEKLLS